MCDEYAVGYMVNVTVSVTPELKHRMEHHREVNWSEVARRAFEEEMHRREMKEAASQIKELRAQSKTPEWSGAEEIRRWRDALR